MVKIANPRWQALFVDKKLFDDDQRVAIRIAKNASSNKEHGVDALSGATLTSKVFKVHLIIGSAKMALVHS